MASFTFSQLTPASFLDRSAVVFGDRLAIVDGGRRFRYGEFADRAHRLAGALAAAGVRPGDRVAALCANSHVMLELHNGVPFAGAVLVPMNIRLSADEHAYIIKHSGSAILVATAEYTGRASELARRNPGLQVVIAGGPADEYESLLASASALTVPLADERELLAINYTSGTTGRPKGVMYHHRGAYLQALAMALHSGVTPASRYLWTLPMFHCDGWCFPWALTVRGATHVCLRAFDAGAAWQLIRAESITHLSAAPTVLTMLAASPSAGSGAPHRVRVDTGGAPPTPTLLARMAGLNFDVNHLYGLTETFGPVCINEWQPEWDELDPSAQARLKARQGVGTVIAEPLRVVNEAGVDVPADGTTIGEIVCRGNDVMLGYYRDDEATAAADMAGWFRTGDLAVMHPDGYVEITDRSKDIIISGGENISSVEVERALDEHPAVLESAVVGRPDELWGETPLAFVTLRPGATATAGDIIEHARARLAHFKAPRDVIFAELPKTSTGKVQKTLLRDRARSDVPAAVRE
jgi:fatty-acyl-CoA synthase